MSWITLYSLLIHLLSVKEVATMVKNIDGKRCAPPSSRYGYVT